MAGLRTRTPAVPGGSRGRAGQFRRPSQCGDRPATPEADPGSANVFRASRETGDIRRPARPHSTAPRRIELNIFRVTDIARTFLRIPSSPALRGSEAGTT